MNNDGFLGWPWPPWADPWSSTLEIACKSRSPISKNWWSRPCLVQFYPNRTRPNISISEQLHFEKDYCANGAPRRHRNTLRGNNFRLRLQSMRRAYRQIIAIGLPVRISEQQSQIICWFSRSLLVQMTSIKDWVHETPFQETTGRKICGSHLRLLRTLLFG